MYANKEKINLELKKLEKYQGQKEFSVFFSSLKDIYSLSDRIESAMQIHKDTSDLDKKVKTLLETLEKIKDEISELTNVDLEYDAVYAIISELQDNFGHV